MHPFRPSASHAPDVPGNAHRERGLNVPESLPPESSRKDRFIRAALGIAVTCLILALMLTPLSPDTLVAAFARIGLLPVLVLVSVALADALLVDVDKLRRTSSHLGISLSFVQSAALSLPATSLGAVLPAQAEEFLKARQMSTHHDIPLSKTVGIVLVDRGYNVGSHLLVLAGSLAALAVGGSGRLALAAGVVGSALMCGALVALVSLVAQWAGKSQRASLQSLTWAARTARPAFNGMMFCYSSVTQLLFALALLLMAHAVGLNLSFAAAVVWRSSAMLISKIPITLGGFGLREGVLALGLGAFGPTSSAVAVALLFGVVATLVPALAALSFQPFLARTLGSVHDDIRLGGRTLADWWRRR